MAGASGRARLVVLSCVAATTVLATSFSNAEDASGPLSTYARVTIDSDDGTGVDYVRIDTTKREILFFHTFLQYDCPGSRPCVNSGDFRFAMPESCEQLRPGGSWGMDGRTFVVLPSLRSAGHDIVAIEVRDAQDRREGIAHYSYERGVVGYLNMEPGNTYSVQYTLESRNGVLAGKCVKPRRLHQVPHE